MKLLILFLRGALAALRSPLSLGAHQGSQIKGVWWLLLVNTCTLGELSGGVNRLWISSIERCFQTELHNPPEVWMEKNLFRIRMVDADKGAQTASAGRLWWAVILLELIYWPTDLFFIIWPRWWKLWQEALWDVKTWLCISTACILTQAKEDFKNNF